VRMKSFYDAVTWLCTQRGISITALGIELGLSKATTAGWKKGAQPQAKTLKAISDYFDVPIDFLVVPDDSVRGQFKIWKEVILFSNGDLAIKLQELINDTFARYCIQYAGSGKYYPQIENAIEALNKRWNKEFKTEELLKMLDTSPILNTYPGNPNSKNYANNIHNSSLVQGDDISIKRNHAENTLSDQEAEILRIFAKLDGVQRAQVIVYAASLKKGRRSKA